MERIFIIRISRTARISQTVRYHIMKIPKGKVVGYSEILRVEGGSVQMGEKPLRKRLRLLVAPFEAGICLLLL